MGLLFVREAASNPFPGYYLSVQFSESVEQSLSLADIQVTNLSLNQNVVPASLQYLPATQTAIIRFNGRPLMEIIVLRCIPTVSPIQAERLSTAIKMAWLGAM